MKRHRSWRLICPALQALSAFATLAAFHPVAAQQRDIESARRQLFAVDSSLAAIADTMAADRAVTMFVSRFRGRAPILIPDSNIFSGIDHARAPMRARYATPGARFNWTPQHAVVNSSGDFGCTAGTTRTQSTADAGKPRFGRYLTCWRYDQRVWRQVAHSRNGETTQIPEPDKSVDGTPHAPVNTGGASPAVALKAIQDADAAFAKLASDSGPGLAFERFAAPDALLLGAAPKPRKGPAEIGAAFATFPSTGKFSWAPVRSYGYASGGLGFTAGEAVIQQDGTTSRSKYITVWRLEPDGSWKYIFDLGSARP